MDFGVFLLFSHLPVEVDPGVVPTQQENRLQVFPYPNPAGFGEFWGILENFWWDFWGISWEFLWVLGTHWAWHSWKGVKRSSRFRQLSGEGKEGLGPFLGVPNTVLGPNPQFWGSPPHSGGPKHLLGVPKPNFGSPKFHFSGPKPHFLVSHPHFWGPSPIFGVPNPVFMIPNPIFGVPSPIF